MANKNGVGRVINQRYEALDIIGRGGQGVVYRAFDRWLERPVAIKVLDSKAARDPHLAERLIREQQALSALKGTSAVEVLDICRGNDGELCLVMELLKGTDLDEALYWFEERGERMELYRVAEIFGPIVDTLEVAHKAGILHRDLKPANVFLLEGGGVRLLDFGMARLKQAAPLTAAGTVMGSPSFMAPEAWKGQSTLVDHRADVYSLGVILFRVLAGDLPFSGASLQEKFMGTTKSARPSLVAVRPDLPRDADDWVAVALAVDREQRFQNVRALWNAFLSTFDTRSLDLGKPRLSFWAAAKGAVRKMTGSEQPPAPLPAARPRSVPAPEPTIELDAADLRAAPPPLRRPKPAENTFELSASELLVEDAPAAAPGPTANPPPARGPEKPPRPPRRRERSSQNRRGAR